jgi:ribosomal protein uS17
MADEEKNETTEEAPVPDAEVVSDTTSEPEETPVPEATPEAEAPEEESSPVSDTAVVSDTSSEPEETPEAAATPEVEAAEEVSDTEEAAPAKKQRSQRHVPRTERRARTKVTREKPKTRKPIVRLPKPEAELGRRQERRGVVVSDKGDKTIVVKVDMIKSHPKYKKVIRRSTRFHAHDEANTAGVGDIVRIVETRPLSKTKRWRLAEIVEKAK